MPPSHRSNAITNIVVAGLGGQGVLKASDILANTAFRAGFDVKKSEIHGMSQRGGSVSSDVRFGKKVFSPMVPPGAADCLVVLSQSQVEVARPMLKAGGVLIEPSMIDEARLSSKKSLNVALLGALARHLDLADNLWHAAIVAALPEKLHAANLQAFALGKGT
jgi:indolepyruvate ferredoxin oxidoreductase beta subunit